MKKTIFLFAIIFSLFSCSKDDEPTPVPVVPELTFTKTEKIVTAPIRNISSFWWAIMDKNGSTEELFYIHNHDNTATVTEKGMMEYNLATNTFTDKAKSSNVVAAGYMSNFTDGNGGFYYISNEFNFYNKTTNSWTSYAAGSPEFPNSVYANHGESKGCTIRSVGKVFYIGGRTACKTVKYFNWTNNTWNFAADYPLTISGGPAVATDTKDIYALGGYLGSSVSSKKFYKLDVATNTWITLPEAPVAPMLNDERNSIIYLKKRIIFLGEDKLLHIFNTETNTWQTNTIDPAIPVNVSGWVDAHLDTNPNATTGKFYILYRKANSTLGIQEYQ
ncbi:MAG: kelch repeat-containing protein [Flavobacterium sp.]|uniref:kelch repeat-containing protein n=1 Tax=Flavobacterium sp. TaxID=239 RepID=UPI0022C6A6DD|nr:kelch repeat-containing protein [Flavobacterium sp.]MCZ8197798.1 kelch repeat-containing protein [Flavobacterium sp.]